jgi:predicted nuclease of predicted toxin-antitoxin system
MTAFYFEEHLSRAVADGLIRRGYTVIMAVDVGMEIKDDDTEHLVYARERGLVMVTFDHPFAGRVMSRSDHTGLVCLGYSIRENIGRMMDVLTEFAELYDPQRDAGQVFWLS